MNASELKYNVEQAGVTPHYFTRKVMRFFGDTMSNYGVRETTITTSYDVKGNYNEGGVQVKVWELFRCRPVLHGLKNSAYFDQKTFGRVYPKV